jgi:hypothetical protein
MQEIIYNSLEAGNAISYGATDGLIRYGRIVHKNVNMGTITITALEIDQASENLSSLKTSHLYGVKNLTWYPDVRIKVKKEEINQMISVINLKDYDQLCPRAVGNLFQFTCQHTKELNHQKKIRTVESTQFTDQTKGNIIIMERLTGRIYSEIMSSNGIKSKSTMTISCTMDEYNLFKHFVNGK